MKTNQKIGDFARKLNSQKLNNELRNCTFHSNLKSFVTRVYYILFFFFSFTHSFRTLQEFTNCYGSWPSKKIKIITIEIGKNLNSQKLYQLSIRNSACSGKEDYRTVFFVMFEKKVVKIFFFIEQAATFLKKTTLRQDKL